MTEYQKFKLHVFEIIEVSKNRDILSTLFDIILSLIVALSCGNVIAELADVPENVEHILLIFEYVIT